MALKTNAAEFRAALSRHSRQVVYHWTPAARLASILEHGILCRRKLDKLGIAYEPHGYGRAGKEADFADYVCVSFHPQKGMMKGQTGSLAVIEMSCEIVITAGAFYCPQNTAKSEYNFDELVNCTSVECLDALFEGPNEWRLRDWQAEIWIPDGISTDKFSRVLFRNEAERDQAVADCSSIAASLPNTLPFVVGADWVFPSHP